MSLANAFEIAMLDLVVNNIDIATIGDAGGLLGSVADGNLYLALFTDDPGEAGSYTNEATYPGYARKAVSRNGTAIFTAGAMPKTNTVAIAFDPCTSGGDTITHFALVAASGGTPLMIASGTCSLVVSTGVTPTFAIGALSISLD
jgi:hypothetical protein